MTKFSKTIGLALIGLAVAAAPDALAAATKQKDDKAMCTIDSSGVCRPGQAPVWRGGGDHNGNGGGPAA